MSKTGIFFGSSTGNTEAAAKKMAEMLDADVFDVGDNPAGQLGSYDNLILGTSTLGDGDLQDDWEVFIEELEKASLEGKVVAIFGLGDGDAYPDTFVDGIGTIYNAIKDKGCRIVGFTDTEGYIYDASTAEVEGKFVGLPLDDDNQDELTDERIQAWIGRIKPAFN
jgi:flavodoxin I